MSRAASPARAPALRAERSPRREARADSYWSLSTRPLTILLFLLPLLAVYELGTLAFLSDAGLVEVVRARMILNQVFDLFGAVGFHLPPILLTAVLLTWHLLERRPRRVRADVLIGMGAESFLWTLPLLVVAALAGASPVLAQTGAPAAHLQEMSWQAKLTLSLGAGIYEELVFRLILISLVHFLLVDLFRAPDAAAYVVAAVASALTFTFYHNVLNPSGGADLGLLFLYGFGGLYLAVIFIVRGFGIAVATHACYDLVTLLVLSGAATRAAA